MIYAPKHIKIQYEALILWSEWFLLALAFSIYMYFIATSVIQVVLRQELMVSIQEEKTRVSELEAEYFERSSKITDDMISEYGLVALSDPQYLSVSSFESDNKLTRND